MVTRLPRVSSPVDVAWLRTGGPEPLPRPVSTPEIRSERRKATMEANRLRTGFRVHDAVTTNCPRSPRFHNLAGRVITTNLGEVGVSFTASDDIEAWFLPSELTHR